MQIIHKSLAVLLQLTSCKTNVLYEIQTKTSFGFFSFYIDIYKYLQSISVYLQIEFTQALSKMHTVIN